MEKSAVCLSVYVSLCLPKRRVSLLKFHCKSYFAASHRGGPGLIPSQLMLVLWWTKRQVHRRVLRFFPFLRLPSKLRNLSKPRSSGTHFSLSLSRLFSVATLRVDVVVALCVYIRVASRSTLSRNASYYDFFIISRTLCGRSMD